MLLFGAVALIGAGAGAGMAFAPRAAEKPTVAVPDMIGPGGSGPTASPNPDDPYGHVPERDLIVPTPEVVTHSPDPVEPDPVPEPYVEPCHPAFGGPRLGQRETEARREFIERGGDPACLPLPDWYGSVDPKARIRQVAFCVGASERDLACVPWSMGGEVETWVRQRLRS